MTRPISGKGSPSFLLIVAVFAVSTASLLIRYALEEASALMIAVYRLSFSALISLLLWLLGSARNREARKLALSPAKLALIGLSGLFLALHFLCWISSLSMITVSSSVVLVTTTPIWVGLFAKFVLRERLNPLFFWGIALALLGALAIGGGELCVFVEGTLSCNVLSNFLAGNKAWGLLLALAGAWMGAGYILIGRRLSSELGTLPYTSMVYTVSALILIALALFRGENFFHYSGKIWFLFLALALVPHLLGHSLFNYSLKHFSAPLVSTAMLGEPIGYTLLAFLLLNESPSLFEVSGGLLILGGILLALLPAKNGGTAQMERGAG